MNIDKEQIYKDLQELNELYEDGVLTIKRMEAYLDKIAHMATAKEAELREEKWWMRENKISQICR